jgi:hypothetical protein
MTMRPKTHLRDRARDRRGNMMIVPLFDPRAPRKRVRSCCGAMRQALRLRPPVLQGDIGRKSLGIVVYNTYSRGEAYRYLPRQDLRNCPWCGKVVNRWCASNVDYRRSARYWEKQAKNYRYGVKLPQHACAWLRLQLSVEDTYIAFGPEEGLMFPRFIADVPGGRLRGTGIPIWHCPGCGEEMYPGHPAPTTLPQEAPLPRGTNHPRY